MVSINRSTVLLILLGASFILFAIAEQFIDPQVLRASALAHGFIIGALCYAWCRAEAWERGKLSPGRSALWAGLLPIIGVPVYLFRTRGAKRGLISTGKALLLLLAMGAASFLTSAAIEALRS